MSVSLIIIALWIVFYSYWLISAIGAKKAVRATPWRKGAGVRLLLFAAAVMLMRTLRLRHIFVFHPSSMALHVIGLLVCVAGLGGAVWARINLGRNWGTPMSLKEGHELVTSGPYRYVRHPIYTGILVALVGSGLAAGTIWLVFFAVVCPFFIYSARIEERLMMQTLADIYPEYRKRTSALIPFVW